MKSIVFDPETIRESFPALQRKIKGQKSVLLDGPGGTQVPRRVLRAISNYYRYYNSNTHGMFQASIQTDHILQAARSNMSVLLGAEGPHTISIGQNMTSLNFSLSRAFSHILQRGDEILISQLDHEANRGPWLTLREQGISVKEVNLLPEGKLDYNDLEKKIGPKTRLVAIGWASNAFGTVNNLKKIRKLSYDAGAWLLVDAVHYVPHFPVNVRKYGIDLLLCSSYKFYGPHLGFLYSKPGLLDSLPVDRLRTQQQHAPYRIETGTLNHAAIAGINATIGFLASLGEGKNIREQLKSGMKQINRHEQNLARMLYDEFGKIKDLYITGPDFSEDERAPTISFVHKKYHPEQVCKYLADHGINTWNGHFYAIRAMEVLGLQEKGGVTRCGISMYTSEEDVAYLIDTLKKM